MATTSPLKDKLLIPFIAPPNGGKGTQTALLNKEYGLPAFDMGATLRRIRKDEPDSALAHELASYMDNGQLVPPATVVKVFSKGMEDLATANPKTRGFILDGFPRNGEQANALISKTDEWGARIAKVIYLNVPDELLLARSRGRRMCSQNDHRTYNLDFPEQQPKRQKLVNGEPVYDQYGKPVWLCDDDGADLYIRKDDLNMENRLKVYREETAPILKTFSDMGLVAEIKGDNPIATIASDIEKALLPDLQYAVAGVKKN